MFKTIFVRNTILSFFAFCLFLGGILGFANVVSAEPKVTISLVPPSGGGSNTWADKIEGTASGVDFSLHKIALYALGDVWYIQPFGGSLIDIKSDGRWTTGTHLGQGYAVLLVKASYKPLSSIVRLPSIGGDVVATTIATPILVTPKSGAIGDPVSIAMDPVGPPSPNSDFGNEQGASKVTFNGIDAGKAEKWANTKITVKVPQGATSGTVLVTVGDQTWIGTINKRLDPDSTMPDDTMFTVSGACLVVWPGDTNNDCVVDARDVLPIGIHWGKTGPKRENTSIEWKAQCIPKGWESPESARADANGDGVVDARDVLPIGANWNKKCDSILGAPPVASIFRKEINHQKYAVAYAAMLDILEADPFGKKAVELKNALRQLIWMAKNEPILQNLLGQNFPNPFNPETWIPYQLSADAKVNIHIYNVSGDLVCTIPLGYKKAGSYLLKDEAAYWDGRDAQGISVASGIYFYQLEAGKFHTIRKLVVAK